MIFTPTALVGNGKPFPENTIECGDMGNPAKSQEVSQKTLIKCCPLCGESLPESPTESVTNCPACGFDLNLLVSPQKSKVPKTQSAYVPRLAFILIATQIVLSGLFASVFLLFASLLYFGIPQLIAAIQIMAMVTLGLFVFFLRQQKNLVVVRIGLVIIGMLSLPLGVCAIAAALAISPIKRWCIVCGKQIRWGAYIECQECQTSMHRWGSCRTKRLETVAATSESGISPTQIEWTCPNCYKLMDPQFKGGPPDG